MQNKYQKLKREWKRRPKKRNEGREANHLPSSQMIKNGALNKHGKYTFCVISRHGNNARTFLECEGSLLFPFLYTLRLSRQFFSFSIFLTDFSMYYHRANANISDKNIKSYIYVSIRLGIEREIFQRNERLNILIY